SAADTPMTTTDRVRWIIDDTLGFRSIAIVGPMGAAFQTAVNTPPEWQRSWHGLAKRYLQREADVALSDTITAGLGAAWGEDLLDRRLGHGSISTRVRYAIAKAFVAKRADQKEHPAWARYAGNILNNVIENAWLPPSATTFGQTTARSGLGMLTRIG